MRAATARFILHVGIVVALITGGTLSWGQACPAAPNYNPNQTGNTGFSANQNCLTLNGNAAFGAPAALSLTPPLSQYQNPPVNPPAGVNIVLRLTPNAKGQTGSAWFNTTQAVSGAFSTTFTFQVSGADTVDGPADGFTFVIQNSPAGAAAIFSSGNGEGCGIGFGDAPDGNCTLLTGGITNSLAVEFDTYQNTDIADPNANHVAIQSCGAGPNSVEGPPLAGSCQVANNSLVGLLEPGGNPLVLSDGSVHSVTITYNPSSLSNCGPNQNTTCSSLDVILDGNDLFPGGVLFDLTTLGLNNGNAYVGFTSATGAGVDDHDILTWTFTPQSQSGVIPTNTPLVLSFPNAAGNNVYDYTAQLTTPYANPVAQVQPILLTQQACNALVDVKFWPAQCFVYQNAENSGLDASVMFALTCPDSPNGVCGTGTNFFATLGTDFSFSFSDNPWFFWPGVFLGFNPQPGWLKGVGPDPTNPCNGVHFQSNQISGFTVSGDPGGRTFGSSGGGGSCWVSTYNTPGELAPAIKIKSPTLTTYKLNQVVTANYTCSNPITSKPVTSPTGPYLTAATCSQSSGTQGACTQTSSGLTCTGTVDTSSRGLHSFWVMAADSGGNVNWDVTLYNVK